MHNTTDLLQRQLHAYSDGWRFESERDVPPWELEGVLEAGVSIFRLIRRLDEHLRSDGVSAASRGRGGEIGDLYADWLRSAAGPLGRLNQLESEGCFIADAGDFRSAEREARGLLHLPLEAVFGHADQARSAGPTVPEIGGDRGYTLPA